MNGRPREEDVTMMVTLDGLARKLQTESYSDEGLLIENTPDEFFTTLSTTGQSYSWSRFSD